MDSGVESQEPRHYWLFADYDWRCMRCHLRSLDDPRGQTIENPCVFDCDVPDWQLIMDRPQWPTSKHDIDRFVLAYYRKWFDEHGRTVYFRVDELAHALRIKRALATQVIARLIAAGMLEPFRDGYRYVEPTLLDVIARI